MKKVSAVNWLFGQSLGLTLQLSKRRISHRNWELEMVKISEQAKEMEKQQIINFTDNYVDNCVIPNENMAIPTIMDVPQYYNETFKNK